MQENRGRFPLVQVGVDLPVDESFNQGPQGFMIFVEILWMASLASADVLGWRVGGGEGFPDLTTLGKPSPSPVMSFVKIRDGSYQRL